ncbi:retrograde regulation protein 2 [Tieghemiomyces parasiticus]|uniref:Retrograde regulation protein 2 n=1 Tax=Tieghemiomyces parasiticus TaxID=78921 RepID=A0A9W8AET8_9FUNG|nr:retrograde regulation protein 2 [Tieghemiomyces parasiticus]
MSTQVLTYTGWAGNTPTFRARYVLGLLLGLLAFTAFGKAKALAPRDSPAPLNDPQPPFAVVDMGSNGIRLGIYGTSASPHADTSLFLSLRGLPVLANQKSDISLSEAMAPPGSGAKTKKYGKSNDAGPAALAPKIIPAATLDAIAEAFRGFRKLCKQHNASSIVVVATEATRVATNRDELLGRIRDATTDSGLGSSGAAVTSIPSSSDPTEITSPNQLHFQSLDDPAGWQVRLLSTSIESHMTTLGTQTSYSSVNGYVMDMGGGSIEVSSVTYDAPYIVGESVSATTVTSGGFAAYPYGANVLTQRLDGLDAAARTQLAAEILATVSQITASPSPNATSTAPGNAAPQSLYLTGGGFRSLATISMFLTSYPMSVLHGYRLDLHQFLDLTTRLLTDEALAPNKLKEIDGISKTRSRTVASVAFLVQSLRPWLTAHVDTVYFSEAGVQQGVLATVLTGSPALPGPAQDVAPGRPSLFSWQQDPLMETIRMIRATKRAVDQDPTEAWQAAVLNTWLATLDRNITVLDVGSPWAWGGRLLNATLAVSNLCTGSSVGGTDKSRRGIDSDSEAVMALGLFTQVAEEKKDNTTSASAGSPLPSPYPVLTGPGVALTHPERALLAMALYYRYGGSETSQVSGFENIAGLPSSVKTARVVGRLLHLVYTISPNDWSVVADGKVQISVVAMDQLGTKLALSSPSDPNLTGDGLVQTSLSALMAELVGLRPRS